MARFRCQHGDGGICAGGDLQALVLAGDELSLVSGRLLEVLESAQLLPGERAEPREVDQALWVELRDAVLSGETLRVRNAGRLFSAMTGGTGAHALSAIYTCTCGHTYTD